MPTLLVVEDDKMLREAYEHKLRKEGFTVVTAEDGDVALDTFQAARPDLVVLDLVMTKRSGLEFLDEVAKLADERLRGTPVIVMTNVTQPGYIEQVKTHGVREYLVKSDTTMGSLVEKIKKHLAPA
ncbi:MAG TPA: response regulator [Candidatus Baltobacteraceae bacterium]|jgi:CheY-like chemotaxis protein|nr:response regulator [Candidatus Baltobacteraceae bacterium]